MCLHVCVQKSIVMYSCINVGDGVYEGIDVWFSSHKLSLLPQVIRDTLARDFRSVPRGMLSLLFCVTGGYAGLVPVQVQIPKVAAFIAK